LREVEVEVSLCECHEGEEGNGWELHIGKISKWRQWYLFQSPVLVEYECCTGGKWKVELILSMLITGRLEAIYTSDGLTQKLELQRDWNS
jgi:hypothetical protein